MSNRIDTDFITRLQYYDVAHFPKKMALRCTLIDPMTSEKYMVWVYDNEPVPQGRLMHYCMCKIAEQWNAQNV